MELNGLAFCLAHSRPGNAGVHDATWRKLQRLIGLCPRCHFKTVNKVSAIRQLKQFLDGEKKRKPPFDRLYPTQDQLLDTKPETIYHFDALEQQAVLALARYLCVSRGHYLHKILPLLLRYLATLHLAKWPPHYFKNLFLMKYQQAQTGGGGVAPDNSAQPPPPQPSALAEHATDEDGTAIAHKSNLNAIEEEPLKMEPVQVSDEQPQPQQQHAHDERDADSKASRLPAPGMIQEMQSLTTEKSGTGTGTGTGTMQSAATSMVAVADHARDSDHEEEEEKEDTLASKDKETGEIEIKYDEDISDVPSPQPHGHAQPASQHTRDSEILKYMDNPLRSPLCQFVMEFIYVLGDISHACAESAPVIRQALIIVLEEYMKLLKAKDDDGYGPSHVGVPMFGVGGGGADDDLYGHGAVASAGHYGGMMGSALTPPQHSFYVVVPIVWGMLNAMKEDLSVNLDVKSAVSINKCVDALSKYNKHTAFNTLWKTEWDILSTGVRASLLAYFLPAEGPIEKAPRKHFETRSISIRDYFSASMDIIGVKKSPSSIEVREQHMRLATICALYDRSLRDKLEKVIKEILGFIISKYIKSSFNVYSKIASPSKPTKKTGGGGGPKSLSSARTGHSSRTLKYRMRDQTILINACCLVLEQLAEKAPGHAQEIAYYFQSLLITRNAIYLQDEEINERLMDALARVCQCELRFMEEQAVRRARKQQQQQQQQQQMRQQPPSPPNNYSHADGSPPAAVLLEDRVEEEKHALVADTAHGHAAADENEEAKYEQIERRHEHQKKGPLQLHAYGDKHWYDDSSTRTVFNELENNFNDSINDDTKLINRALRIYGAMMVKVNHRLITQQFLSSSLKSRLTQKLTVILPYLIDTAINQQETEVQFVKEIVTLLVQSYLSKSSSYQLDTKRKIAEAFAELSSNLTQYHLRQFILAELLKMFTTLSKEILNHHVKKKTTLVLAANEMGLILPAIAVLCTPLFPLSPFEEELQPALSPGAGAADGGGYLPPQTSQTDDEDDDDDDEEELHPHPAKRSTRRAKKERKRRGRGGSDAADNEMAEAAVMTGADLYTPSTPPAATAYHDETQQPLQLVLASADAAANPSYFGHNQYVADEWGITLRNNHAQTVAMFREFWNQIIFFDFVASTNNEYKMYLQTIAAVTPVLVSGSSTLFAGGLIHEALKNKSHSLSIDKQINAMRHSLEHILKADPQLDAASLSPDTVMFLNVVYHVESFRVYSGTAYGLAHYLTIHVEAVVDYVEAVVDYVFERYLEHMYRSKASRERLLSLEGHAEYLLAMCCHRASRIRSKAHSWLQHKLVATYPLLQWRPKCLANVLDVVSKLERLVDDVSTELYATNDEHSVITFNAKFSLDLPEDRKSRAEIRSIVLEIAGSWLQSAWTLAPSEMISVIAHKLSLYQSPLLSSLMYTQCQYNVHRDVYAHGHADGAGAQLQPTMGLMYVVSKCERYLGVMEGLYRTHLLHGVHRSFGHSKAQLFIQTMKRYIALYTKLESTTAPGTEVAVVEQLAQGMIEEMYQCGALIVWTHSKSLLASNAAHSKAHHFRLPVQELLHLLCMVPAIVFSTQLVLTATFVWQWIMTTSAELQHALILQMRPAWAFLIEQRKGIFANRHVPATEIEAHDTWISWMLNSVENIIKSSPESMENIAVIMMDGLAAVAHNTRYAQSSATKMASSQSILAGAKTNQNGNSAAMAMNQQQQQQQQQQQTGHSNNNKNSGKTAVAKLKSRFSKVQLPKVRNASKQSLPEPAQNNNHKRTVAMTAAGNKKSDTPEDDPASQQSHHTFDAYIATVGATLRMYTAVARVLTSLRAASVPLLSKTIATMLRSRMYEGVLQLFECQIVWRYPWSWKHVSSSAKAIVELFQFFMTEHRHIIKRHSGAMQQRQRHGGGVGASHHHLSTSSTLGAAAAAAAGHSMPLYVPSPPSVSLENHRSKTKTKSRAQYGGDDANGRNGAGSSVYGGSGNYNGGSVPNSPHHIASPTPQRSSLVGAVQFLNAGRGELQQHRHSGYNNAIRRAHTTHSHHGQGHRRTQSTHHMHGQHGHQRNRSLQRGGLRHRNVTLSKAQTQRSSSIRRNSFGHVKNTSIDSDDLDLIVDGNGGIGVGGGGGEDTQRRQLSMLSLANLNVVYQDVSHEAALGSPHATGVVGGGAPRASNSNAYLYKLDSDDVYYWEGNNAFIQDTMANWLHDERGWCQMMSCALLANELERLCAWYNTRDNDNVQARDATNGFTSSAAHVEISGLDDDAATRAEVGGSAAKNVDDRISKFAHQDIVIDYISKIGDNQWSKLVDTAWSFTPLLAVRFHQRFAYKDLHLQQILSAGGGGNGGNALTKSITRALKQHIHQHPKSIQNIPDAVHLLITDSTVKKDGIELEELCQFSCAPLYKCLQLLKEPTLTHSIVNQYLFRSLRYESQINMERVIFVVPQLVQALRFDPSGMLRDFLIDCAANDLTMAHQLIWLCDALAYDGEDMHSMENKTVNGDEDNDEDFCKAMERLSMGIRETFRGRAEVYAFYEHEFAFFDEVNSASAEIDAGKYSKAEKKKLIRAALIEIRNNLHTQQRYGQQNDDRKLYMPTNPTWEVVDILPDSVIALQSAAKVPFLVDFQVKKHGDDVGHMIQKRQMPDKEPQIEVQKCIFKTHDDCGQDALALQIIEYFRTIFKDAGLPLLLFPYKVIATRSGKDKVIGGMIECVTNARSRSDLGNENNYRLKRYFIETYGVVESKSFRKAQRNFILSLAGYAVVCYLLQIKDRHNANIMINTKGHLIHIDFGFLFDISPGKNIGFERAGFKINDEMVDLIGDDGTFRTPLFLWFVELCIRGYLVCREHMDEIIGIIELASHSRMPCFLPQTMHNLRSRFVPERSPTQAAQHMKEMVIHACSTWTTNAYDEFQKRTQKIWKAPARDED